MKSKKAFTVVELVIVIAIIAILAAVLIPTFASLIKKANVSKDEQLIRNLNTALATSRAERNNKPHANMTEALEAAEKFGYEVDKINASATDNEILWDQKNDVFCYLNGEKVEYIPESVEQGDKLLKGDYQLWKIYNAKSGAVPAYADQTCSIYLGKDAVLTSAIVNNVLKVKVGVDVGKRTDITSIEYSYTPSGTEQAHAAAIIRTNSANTELVVNASQDTVKHYDAVGTVHVIAVDSTNCYEENGKAAFTQVDSGKYKTTATADVELLFVSSSSVNLELAKGTVDHAHAISKEVADSINASNPGVTFDYDNNSEQNSAQDVYHHVSEGTQIGLTSSFDNNKQVKAVTDVVSVALDEERKQDFAENNYWIGVASDSFAGGDGSENSPYLIATAEQLSRVAYVMYSSQYAQYQDKFYKLTADIDLSSKCWIPIVTSARGKDTNRYFTGTFDGDNHTITGLNNTGLSMSYIATMANDSTPVDGVEYVYGLFGDINGATIKNVKLANVSIKNGYGLELNEEGKAYLSDSVGALVGYAFGNITISNCHTLSGLVEGYDGASGIVGKFHDDNAQAVIDNCSNAASINAVRRAAGIVGNVRATEYLGDETKAYIKVTNCSNTGDITSVFTEDISIVSNYNSNYYTACGIAVLNRHWGDTTKYPNTSGNGRNCASSLSFSGCTNSGTITNSKENGTSTAAAKFDIAGGQN